jgi:hypothetical protein
MSIITPAPHCIAYCKFAVSFTIKMCESYFFVLLSNIVLVIKITSPRILGSAFLFLQKKRTFEIVTEAELNVKITLEVLQS